jgi:hypothetical protein
LILVKAIKKGIYLFKVTPVLVNRVANATSYFYKLSRHSLQTSTSGVKVLKEEFKNLESEMKMFTIGNKIEKLNLK